MEIATDERFFTEEWFIENITCWNVKIHGKAIVHKNVIVDQLNFRLELYPNGQNGDEEHLVVVVYDENQSDGELSFISSDGSLLCELMVKDLDWNECYVILPTGIKFDDIVKHIARKPFHVDCLTLRYQKRKSFDVIFRVRNEIEVIDTSIEIPTTQLDVLPWTSKCQSIVNFLIDGKLATLQFIASTTAGLDGGLIHFEFMLLNMVKNSSSPNYFLMRSCVYLLNGEGDSLAFEENEHVFLNLRNWNFSYLRSGGEKGLSLLIRLKFVTGSKRDNYTSCWFQPQQMNISLTNRLATSVAQDLSVENPSEYTLDFSVNKSENTINSSTPQAMHQFAITKASEFVPGEIFTQSDVVTDQAGATKSDPTDFSKGNSSENTSSPKIAQQQFNITKPVTTSVLAELPSEKHSDDTHGANTTLIDPQFNIKSPDAPSEENSPESTNDPKGTSAEQQFDHTEPDHLSGKVLNQCDVTDQVGAAKSHPTDLSKENSPENTNDPKGISAEQQFDHTEPDHLSGKVLTQCDVTDQVGAAKSYPMDFSKENSPENTNDPKDTSAEQQFDHTEPDDLSDGEDFPPTMQVVAADGTVYTISVSELHVNESGHGAAVNYWPEKFYEKNTEDSVTAMKVLLTVFNKELSNEIPSADFQLTCGNTVFRVHREVLGCHSKVFRPLLSKDSSDSMDLPDFDLGTFCQFVFYLYSLDAEGMPWEVALKLYCAAKKYKVPSLKRKCSTILSANVSVSNVCEILLLADQYHDKMLLQVVHEFILNNYNDVLNSKEWKCLKDSNGPLLCKTLSNLADKVMLEKTKCFADFE